MKLLASGFFILVLLAAPAHAVVKAGPMNVSSIRVIESGDVYIIVSGDPTGLCSGPFRVKSSSANKEAIMSVALSALMSGKKIRIELSASGCTGYGTLIGSIFIDA